MKKETIILYIIVGILLALIVYRICKKEENYYRQYGGSSYGSPLTSAIPLSKSFRSPNLPTETLNCMYIPGIPRTSPLCKATTSKK